MTDQDKTTAYAIGGPMRGKRLAGRGSELVIMRPTTSVVSWMSNEGPVQAMSPRRELYTLWHVRVPGWIVALPAWVHSSVPMAGTGPMVDQRDIPFRVVPEAEVCLVIRWPR